MDGRYDRFFAPLSLYIVLLELMQEHKMTPLVDTTYFESKKKLFTSGRHVK